MNPIKVAPGNTGIVPPHVQNAVHNGKVAEGLKPAIKEMLMRVRFGAALPAAELPKQTAKGWKAPNGDALLSVVLDKAPKGTADVPTNLALVNPKTNQYFVLSVGGLAGTLGHGPLALPTTSQFKGKTFDAKELERLSGLANGTAPKPATTPATKKQAEAAFGAYSFHKLLKWSAKGPPSGDVVKKYVVKKDAFPDGYTTTALVLRNGKVAFQRSGGFAGLTQYSQAVDVHRLPK